MYLMGKFNVHRGCLSVVTGTVHVGCMKFWEPSGGTVWKELVSEGERLRVHKVCVKQAAMVCGETWVMRK